MSKTRAVWNTFLLGLYGIPYEILFGKATGKPFFFRSVMKYFWARTIWNTFFFLVKVLWNTFWLGRLGETQIRGWVQQSLLPPEASAPQAQSSWKVWRSSSCWSLWWRSWWRWWWWWSCCSWCSWKQRWLWGFNIMRDRVKRIIAHTVHARPKTYQLSKSVVSFWDLFTSVVCTRMQLMKGCHRPPYCWL